MLFRAEKAAFITESFLSFLAYDQSKGQSKFSLKRQGKFLFLVSDCRAKHSTRTGEGADPEGSSNGKRLVTERTRARQG